MSQVIANRYSSTSEQSSAEEESGLNVVVTRNYDESLFIVETVGEEVITRCSECVNSKRKNHRFRGKLMAYNVKRHWHQVHKITLIVALSEKTVVTLKCGNKDSVKELIVRFQVENNLALSIWDSPSAQSLMQPYIDGVGINISSYTVRKFVMSKHEKVAEMIAARLKNRMFSVQFDIATRKNRAVLGISAQFVDPKTFKFEVIAIGMLVLDQSHTGKYIKENVEKCLNSYGLSTLQVYSYTTDNGRNVLKATRDLLEDSENILQENEDSDSEPDMEDPFDGHHPYDATHIRCAAHTVQLAVNDFLQPHKDIIANVREYVRAARPILKKKDLNQPPLNNITRYASDCCMKIIFPIYIL